VERSRRNSPTTTRRFAFVERIVRAVSSTFGAITASINVDTIARAVSSSIARFNPMMPPNAARESASRART
jgi:hypothetical protein